MSICLVNKLVKYSKFKKYRISKEGRGLKFESQ